MAAVDPIQNVQLCKYFSALTPKQATNLCFYSMGANHQDIARLLDATPVTVKKSLESVQKYYSAGSLPELKTVFWAGITFRLICKKYRIEVADFHHTAQSNATCILKPLFPELNKYQITGAVLLSAGLSLEYIASISRHTSLQIEQHITEAMTALGAVSEQLLRMLITSRFILDLC
ncbi:hypothetical protein [Erwinia amylovora]|uniref:hypothetical protein n=2 Tax=Erwinia amylovora TaxID=552 RepID=UPI000C084EB6|nr:hypothetical protein [Erwinia amylovora]